MPELNLQQDNSKMAIGSGRLYGKGLFNDTAISVKMEIFLSEEHTDFIFSVIGEELGFIGCMIVLLLFLLFVFECLRMASRARDMAGRLFCTGMAALVGFQSFYQYCSCHRRISQHGSSACRSSAMVSAPLAESFYIGTGILLNVGLQQRKLNFRREPYECRIDRT